MQELIKYVSDILNIKTESVYTIQDMTEELNKIQDIVAYRSYIKDNIYNIEFKSGYQKFIILTKKYIMLEYSALNIEISDKANILSDKVRDISSEVIKDKRDFWSTGGRWFGGNWQDFGGYDFTNEELSTLKKIGSTKEILKLNEDNMLTYEINKLSKDSDGLVEYQQLPNRLKEIMKNTTKELR